MRLFSAAPKPLTAREGYRLWAESYGDENPVTALDNAAVQGLTPALAGKALLDAGCGTGSRLRPAGAGEPRAAVGIDLVPQMLRRGRHDGPALALAAADVRALPFGAGTFEVVWCRLVVGYVAELATVYAELGRVTRRGGCVIVTDFHPAAARAKLVRNCWDGQGGVHVLEHHTHEAAAHRAAAGSAGLSLDVEVNQVVGPEVRAFYAAAGMLDRYEQQSGMPLVLALRFMN
ncbi:MAG TPA: class I SAM-dependent methyltransferase [Gemmatimonadales bacterium]|nr:class I SAM-dependent methyltransferase [Gemmatimonadales bacterium]